MGKPVADRKLPYGWSSINRATKKNTTLNIVGVIAIVTILISPLWFIYFIDNSFIPLDYQYQFVILIFISLMGLLMVILSINEHFRIQFNNQNFPRFYMTFLISKKDLNKQILESLSEYDIKIHPETKFLKGFKKMIKLTSQGFTIFILENHGLINDVCAIYLGPINDRDYDYEFLKKIDREIIMLKKIQDPEGEKMEKRNR